MKDFAARFHALFAGLPRAYGIYIVPLNPDHKGKRAGDAKTLQAPVTDSLWERHLSGEIQLGIVPIKDDATACFGAIDVDDYKLDHKALVQKVKKLKLPLHLCRSKSGGGHLYAFFKDPTPAVRVRELLAGWAASLGYAAVEIFPKQDALHSTADTGNWINMPYSGGEKTERYGMDPERMGVEEFLKAAERHKIGPKILETAEEFPELLEGAPPCLVTLATNGIPSGQNNNAAFAFAVYARKRWPEEWQERLKEINDAFFNPPRDSRELAELINNSSKRDYNYSCKTQPICDVCQKAVCKNREFGVNNQLQAQTFGLLLDNIIRMEVEPVVYFADFAGRRVKFGSQQMSSQLHMRQLLMEQTNSAPPRMSSVAFDAFIALTMSRALVVEAPVETVSTQRIIALVEQYCINTDSREWKQIGTGGVKVSEGRMHFAPHSLVSDLNMKLKTMFTESDIWVALQGLNVQAHTRNIGKTSINLWSVPEFLKEDENDDATDPI